MHQKGYTRMTRYYKQSIPWKCTKCGRSADGTVKPVPSYGGGCPCAVNRLHTWVKSHF